MRFHRFATLVFLVLVAAALTACGSGTTSGQDVAQAVQQIAAQGTGQAGANPAALTNALATVSAKSLRVRSAPNSDAEVIFGVKQGEQYKVIGLSSDGEWVQLALPDAPTGTGWVSANFVTVEGSITDATVTTVVPSATQVPAAPGTATVATEGTRLRVRTEPNSNAEIAGYVYTGETYPVLETSSDGAWIKIGGRTGTDNLNGGWVSTEFMVVN